MTNDPATQADGATQVPLLELLRGIPRGEVLRITDNTIPFFPETTSIPVGIYAHEVAAEITRLRAELAASAADHDKSAVQFLFYCDDDLKKAASAKTNRSEYTRCAAAAKRAREASTP